jgi:hypothetical protein
MQDRSKGNKHPAPKRRARPGRDARDRLPKAPLLYIIQDMSTRTESRDVSYRREMPYSAFGLLGNLGKRKKRQQIDVHTRDTSRPNILAFAQSSMTNILLRVLKHMLRYAERQKM